LFRKKEKDRSEIQAYKKVQDQRMKD
jgi:hypothetical protein